MLPYNYICDGYYWVYKDMLGDLDMFIGDDVKVLGPIFDQEIKALSQVRDDLELKVGCWYIDEFSIFSRTPVVLVKENKNYYVFKDYTGSFYIKVEKHKCRVVPKDNL